MEWGRSSEDTKVTRGRILCGPNMCHLIVESRSIFRFSSLHLGKPRERMLNPWHCPLTELPMSVLDTEIGCKVQVWTKLAKPCLTPSSDSYGDKVSEIKQE